MHAKRTEERRIHLLAGLILITATLVAGVSVFLIMQRYAEGQLEKTLQLSLQNYVISIDSTIQQRVEATLTIATRPLLIEQMEQLRVTPSDVEVLKNMERAAASFTTSGFLDVSFYGPEGQLVAHAGTPIMNPELDVPLVSPYQLHLMWSDGYVLRVEVPVVNNGHHIGTVLTETQLTKMTGLFVDVQSLGKSGELALCAPLEIDMQCFPLALTKQVYKRMPRVMQGAPLPMSFALAGGTGVIKTEDYRRQEVVAAYSPVTQLGLGTVLKIDTKELYAPIWNQAKRVGPLLLLTPIVGVFLLYWLVAPLIKQLFRSEKQARATNAQLRDSETRVRTILENVVEGIVTISETGAIDSFNIAAETMFGYSSKEVMGRDVSLLLPDVQRDDPHADFQKYIETKNKVIGGVGHEVLAMRNGGQSFFLALCISEVNLDGRRYFICTMRDITDHKAAEATILRLANHDPLTDLPNRNLLQDRIEQAISRHKRSQRLFAVLFIDLDQFKTINDSLGHQIGDALLKSVASRLSNCLREDDTVARQGGDEFIVLLSDVGTAANAAVVARKILAVLTDPHIIAGRELHAGASIGIAIYPQDGEQAETLLKNSDTAMYCAKDAGRNNAQFFTADMNANATERLSLATSLRHALSRNEMELHYQPIVSVRDGHIAATEALLRWRHPELGYVSPVRFIPIAEETGLIVVLGEWVLRTACLQLNAWQDKGVRLDRMVVNLSTRQFRQDDMVQRFTEILAETGVSAERVGLEITESAIMDNPKHAISILGELKAMGFQLSLDDFGTGYSSLSYLKQFPIDKLKIDRSFVKDVSTDPDDEALVGAIIAMAHSLNISVVAEGVEMLEQLAFIKQKQCEEYQGYYFSKPLSGDDLYPKLIAALRAAV